MNVALDNVNYYRYLCLELSYKQVMYFFFPLLYSIYDIIKETGEIILPQPLNLSVKSLTSNGIYLLDNGIDIFIWIGKDVEICEEIFGCNKAEIEYLISPEVL